MRTLAEMLWERCDRDREIEFDPTEGFQHDVKRRVPDSSKAADRLGWEPEISLEESLREYLDWYREAVL
jgi:nucleoside-diphosphate-sugar epimerase